MPILFLVIKKRSGQTKNFVLKHTGCLCTRLSKIKWVGGSYKKKFNYEGVCVSSDPFFKSLKGLSYEIDFKNVDKN